MYLYVHVGHVQSQNITYAYTLEATEEDSQRNSSCIRFPQGDLSEYQYDKLMSIKRKNIFLKNDPHSKTKFSCPSEKAVTFKVANS